MRDANPFSRPPRAGAESRARPRGTAKPECHVEDPTMHHPSGGERRYLHTISHRRIDPPALTGQSALRHVIDEAFLSYNAGRLREACRLFAGKMLADDTTVGLS